MAASIGLLCRMSLPSPLIFHIEITSTGFGVLAISLSLENPATPLSFNPISPGPGVWVPSPRGEMDLELTQFWTWNAPGMHLEFKFEKS